MKKHKSSKVPVLDLQLRTESRHPGRATSHRRAPHRHRRRDRRRLRISRSPNRRGPAARVADLRVAALRARRACATRRGTSAEPPRSYIGPGRSGPAICASATGPRCRPSALLQVLLGDLGEIVVENHDIMPLGLFLAFAEFLSRQVSDVAMRRLTTGSPEFSRRISGSRPGFRPK